MGAIAGYLGRTGSDGILQEMCRKLAHRGRGIPFAPFYTHGDVHAGLLGVTGVQASDAGITVVAEGMIDNADTLRALLADKGVTPPATDMAGLILGCYRAFGFNAAKQLRGAFVFLLHDTHKNVVMIARDHSGARPLYYATAPNGTLVFASEIKALFAHPAMVVEPDLLAVEAFLTFGGAPAPVSLFRGVSVLPAGHRLVWNPGLHAVVEPYWQPAPSDVPAAEQQLRFDRLLDQSVARALNDDCGVVYTQDPVAAAVTASAARQKSGAPLKVFSVSYDDETTRHNAPPFPLTFHRTRVYNADFDILPQLIWSVDAPFAGPEVMSMHLATRLAGQEGAPVLAGGGFPFRRPWPLDVSRTLAPLYMAAIERLPLGWIDRAYGDIAGRLGVRGRRRLVDILRLQRNGDAKGVDLLLGSLMDRHDKDALYTRKLAMVADTYTDTGRPLDYGAVFLTVLDRMTMMNGTAGAAPVLSPELRELFLTAADPLALARNYAARLMPEWQQWRPEPRIFPFGRFMQGRPLRDMIAACLSEDSVRRRGLFMPEGVNNIVAASQAGDVLSQQQVFALTTLEIWFRIFVDHEKGWISG